jgi:hypothetical protein
MEKEMKYMSRAILILLVATLLSSCGLSKENIGETVKTSMQETLNNDPNFQEYNMQVDGVQVFQRGDNSYKGLVAIKYKGRSHDVSVEILVDGDNVMWEASPGAFMFVMQEELQQLENLFQ